MSDSGTPRQCATPRIDGPPGASRLLQASVTSMGPRITKPCSPALVTKVRATARPAEVKKSEDRELEELSKTPRFKVCKNPLYYTTSIFLLKARPLPKYLFTAPAPLVAKPKVVGPVVVPVKVKFHTDDRLQRRHEAVTKGKMD